MGKFNSKISIQYNLSVLEFFLKLLNWFSFNLDSLLIVKTEIRIMTLDYYMLY